MSEEVNVNNDFRLSDEFRTLLLQTIENQSINFTKIINMVGISTHNMELKNASPEEICSQFEILCNVHNVTELSVYGAFRKIFPVATPVPTPNDHHGRTFKISGGTLKCTILNQNGNELELQINGDSSIDV